MDVQGASERAELEAILQTSLAVGVQVHRAGGYTARTDAAMKRVALALGADRAEPAITATLVSVTVNRNHWNRTAIKSAVAAGVNFSELTELSQLTKNADGKSAREVRAELDEIVSSSKRYPAVVVIPAVGVGTAALAGLFGSDLGGILLAGLAGLIGVALRSFLIARRLQPFVFSVACAFVSGGIVAALHGFTGTLEPAVAASVLYLVPGVPLLNGTADLLTGFYLNGLARLTMSMVVLLGASSGLLVAVSLWKPP